MKIMGKNLLIALSIALGAPMAANAGLIYEDFGGNDCSGYFGTGLDSCQIFVNENNERIEISPVIAKYDYETDGVDFESNDLYPSVLKSDFDVDTSAGTWSTSATYDPATDPGVRYWAAKGGNYFRLFWMVEDSATDAGGACSSSYYNLACLNLAQVVTSGDWSTPINSNNGKPYGLSHLTLYNSAPPSIVPEPASLLLMGLGLFALGFSRRQSKRS